MSPHTQASSHSLGVVLSVRSLQRLKRALKNSDVSREEIEDLRRKLLEAVPEQVMIRDSLLVLLAPAL